MYPETEIRSGI